MMLQTQSSKEEIEKLIDGSGVEKLTLQSVRRMNTLKALKRR